MPLKRAESSRKRSCSGIVIMASRREYRHIRARAALARAEAVQLDAIDRGDEGYLPRLLLAQASALRGDVRLANQWFSKAVAHGYLHAAEAERLPALAALRSTPEFQARLRWMRMRAAHLRARVPAD